MNIALSRPLVASLLLTGIIVIATGTLVASWVGLAAAVDERDAKADLLARSVAASRRQTLSPAVGRQTDPFVESDSQTLAAAQLDALIRTVAGDNNGTVLSSKSEAKPGDDGIAGHIEAEAVIEGQNEALQGILIKLEESDPVILVDALAMEPVALSDSSPGDLQAPRLHMVMTVGAYWKATAR